MAGGWVIPVFGEGVSWETGADVAASTLCKALLTARTEDRTFQRLFFSLKTCLALSHYCSQCLTAGAVSGKN